MPFGLPSLGESSWGQKILDSINALKSEQDGRLSAAGLKASFSVPLGNAAASGCQAVVAPTKVGLALTLGSAGQPDQLIAEGLNPYYDAAYGKHVGPYVGYAGTTGSEVGTIMWATSDDGVNWTKMGTLLAASGTVGAPDRYGVTAPEMFIKDGVRYLFYVGLDALGYEGGTKTLCVATRPATDDLTLAGWVRHGAILTASGQATGSSAWRQTSIWHPCIIEHNGVTYCFVNAGKADNTETIGLAQNVTNDLANPSAWAWRDDVSPLFTNQNGSTVTGDPSIIKIDGGYLLALFRAGDSGVAAADQYYTTTDALFPLGWTRALGGANAIAPGPAGSYDELYAHKPNLYKIGGRIFHYYTSVMAGNTNRRSAVAVYPPLNGDFVSKKRTAGDMVVTSATFADVNTALDLTIAAKAGDVLDVGMNLQGFKTVASGTTYMVLDFHTIVSGSPVNSVTTDSAASTSLTGAVPGWGSGVLGDNTSRSIFSGSKLYTVQAGDVVNGLVTLRLRAFVGTSCTIRGTDPMAYVHARNLGRPRG